MLEDYLRTSGHKGHSFTCRGSPQACPKLFLRLFFNLLLRLVVVTVPLFFPIHSSRLTSTDFHLFLSPFRFMLFRCSLFSIDNVTSFGQVYRRTSPCIQAGNRLGFVKVECTGENRSSPYKKKGKTKERSSGRSQRARFPPVVFVLVILIRFLRSFLGNGPRIKISFDEIYHRKRCIALH